jgi:RNA polymerase sigma-70 factor (ECF subfamily)
MATEGPANEPNERAAAAAAEDELIRCAVQGNLGAFAQIVSLYRGRVLRTAYGVVGSAVEAEDVAQEVFVRVWHGLADHHGQGAFAAWIYRITVNAAIDVTRRRRQEVELQDHHTEQIASPEDVVLRRDQHRRIRQAIQSLPPNARATIILREYEQLSYKEIADILQIPIGTVMSRLNYARKLLREKLD